MQPAFVQLAVSRFAQRAPSRPLVRQCEDDNDERADTCKEAQQWVHQGHNR